MYHTKTLNKLIEELSKMPGIGPKSAQRIAFYILGSSKEEAKALSQAILDLKEKITHCSICNNITEENPCEICSNSQRDHSIICVVEEPKDVLAFEKSRGYNGVYHVLLGALSPLEGIGPDELKIKELMERLKKEKVSEVILATNPNTNGEMTAMYLAKLIKPSGIKVTRLAHGIPVGGSIEYVDEETLAKSLEGRTELK
ncbi:recombination mediator RecR [bacterium]|nr:recombination mediator RecR [bacterium]